STTAPSTATSSACARNSRCWILIFRPSKLCMELAIASRNPEAQRAEIKARRRGFPFSALTRRILIVNVLGLAFLMGGIFYLDQFRANLIEERINSLVVQGKIIARAVAEEAAGNEGNPTLDPKVAKEVMLRLVELNRTEAQLWLDNK